MLSRLVQIGSSPSHQLSFRGVPAADRLPRPRSAIACAVGLFVLLCVGGFVWNKLHPPTAEQQANMEALRQGQTLSGNLRFAQSFYPSTYLLRGGATMLGYRRGEPSAVELGPKPIMWEVQQRLKEELRSELEQWQVRRHPFHPEPSRTMSQQRFLFCRTTLAHRTHELGRHGSGRYTGSAGSAICWPACASCGPRRASDGPPDQGPTTAVAADR
jgi:hypothetical protein